MHSLLPKSAEDEAEGAIVEIRAGAGGKEAGIFAAEVWRMYERLAARKRWQVEVVDVSWDMGGGKGIKVRVVAVVFGERFGERYGDGR